MSRLKYRCVNIYALLKVPVQISAALCIMAEIYFHSHNLCVLIKKLWFDYTDVHVRLSICWLLLKNEKIIFNPLKPNGSYQLGQSFSALTDVGGIFHFYSNFN